MSAAVGAAVAGLVAASTLAPAPDAAWATTRVVAVIAVVGAGLYVWTRVPFERFGRLLVLAAAGELVATLSLADASLPYSLGRVAEWIVEGGLIYLMLAFPSGRLCARLDRRLAWAAGVIIATLFLPTALLVGSYPKPAAWAPCVSGCPRNAFMVLGHEPGVVHSVVIPLRETLIVGVFVAVTVRIAWRLRRTTRVARIAVGGVLAVAAVRCAVFAIAYVGRRAAGDSALVEVAIWLLALTVPALALAFLVGLLRWRLYVGASLVRLAGSLRRPVRVEDLRRALADAFEDPTLQVAHPDGGGGWVDGEGHEVAPPPRGAEQATTDVRQGDYVAAVLLHDAALAGERGFVDAAASFAALSLENQRLSARTARLMRQLAESREQIDTIADLERQRIARDLHDGAQQRLVALAIKLEAVSQTVDDPSREQELRTLADDVEAALHEVRSLGSGTAPRALTRHGLRAALVAATRDAPLATTLEVGELGRYPPQVEAAIYFCCLEALQNVAKHARDARSVNVRVAADDAWLTLEVCDDGEGFDTAATPLGSGLKGLEERMEALHGRLSVASGAGRGTCVRAAVPLETR